MQKDDFIAVPPASGMPSAIVTPDTSITGKVVRYNSTGRFAVLNFSNGQMPKMEQTLFIYRAGLKTAELKITGPQNNNDIVADILTGVAQVGDEVRDR